MALAAVVNPIPKCRLCKGALYEGDNRAVGLCELCVSRPEARPILAAAKQSKPPRQARAFTPAERSLIGRLHAHLPADELLRILNERLGADDPDAVPFTSAQLQAEVAPLHEAAAGPGAWGGLRRVIQQARETGVLGLVTADAIADFAVLYQLTSAQRMRLQDVLTHAQEGR